MSAALSSALQKGKAFLKSGTTTPTTPKSTLSADSPFTQAPSADTLFPIVDGDCDHDCETCEIKYPRGFKIDEEEKLYGHINAWATHMLVATGKTDWVRDVADEKGSVMEAVGQWKKAMGNGWKDGGEPSNGVCSPTSTKKQSQLSNSSLTERQKLMLSASNIPPPDGRPTESLEAKDQPTTVLLLPAFTIIENVTPIAVPALIEQIITIAPTTTTPLHPPPPHPAQLSSTSESDTKTPHPAPAEEPTSNGLHAPATIITPLTTTPPTPLGPLGPLAKFTTRPCPHRHLILLCSQKTRDARCGQSAPLLRREFERHLRPLGLYRDVHDERPGGVGIYFISHVGGHKFSANVMIYRRGNAEVENKVEEGKDAKAVKNGDAGLTGGEKVKGEMGEGRQCIWLARVRPEDCEAIVKFTVLQGKVVKPERQLRGGFDREKGLVSW